MMTNGGRDLNVPNGGWLKKVVRKNEGNVRLIIRLSTCKCVCVMRTWKKQSTPIFGAQKGPPPRSLIYCYFFFICWPFFFSLCLSLRAGEVMGQGSKFTLKKNLKKKSQPATLGNLLLTRPEVEHTPRNVSSHLKPLLIKF
jgi:hypothetical protein